MDYEVAVIGSGSAGKEAALLAAKQGRRVAMIEKETLGGTCSTEAVLLFVPCEPAPTHFTVYYWQAGTVLILTRPKSKQRAGPRFAGESVRNLLIT